MAKIPILNKEGKIEYVDETAYRYSGEECAASMIKPLSGFGPAGTYFCIKHTHVSFEDISDAAVSIMESACLLASDLSKHFVTDALYLAALQNEHNNGDIVYHLFHGDSQRQMSFAQELALIINQQEQVTHWDYEMSPQFIRQFEDADIIRKARQAGKIHISDILRAILYSKSDVGRLMERYGIDDSIITRCCKE